MDSWCLMIMSLQYVLIIIFLNPVKYYTNVFSSCMQRKLPQEVCVPLHSVSLLGTSWLVDLQ